MKRLTNKQIELVKDLLNQIVDLTQNYQIEKKVNLLDKLLSQEFNGTDVPEVQDWNETVTSQVREAKKAL